MIALLTAIALAVPQSPCTQHVVPETIEWGTDLRCSDLRGMDLAGANLAGADLTGAWLHDADLHGANLRDTTLEFAHLEGANLRDADLSGAYLRRAVLRDADVYGANLDHADLCWTDVRHTRFLTAASTQGTVFSRSTQLPEELEDPEDDFDWTFKPYFREPRDHLVTVNSLDGISLIQYIDAFAGNDVGGDTSLFDNLGTTVGVDVIGLELVPPLLDATHRHFASAGGIAAALGVGSNQLGVDRFTFATLTVGAFVRPISFLQLETGLAGGVVLSNQFSRNTDASLYVALRVNVRPLVEILDDLAEVVF